IGGGLAGLALAIQCADAGYATILFEKENYPFHRVCGEYISMESYDFLQRCGLPLTDWDLPMINRLQVSEAKGKLHDFRLPLGGFGISRFKLDYELYKLALQKGVEVKTSCKVTDLLYLNNAFKLKTSQGIFHSRLSAGSFGKKSNLDVRWNRSFAMRKPGKLSNYIGVKYHIRYPQPPDTIALHNFANGYCGISGVEEDRCCLCYLTTADNLVGAGNSVRTMERELLGRNPQLRKIFAGAEFLYDEPLTISQVSFLPKQQVENHVLMLGDAAGLIPPLCGNGMSMAMHASVLAFGQLRSFLAGQASRQQMEANYQAEWKRQFARRLQTGRTVQYFFGGNLSTALFLRTMRAIPTLGRAVIRQTHGQPF
ncbi:MAG: FAD-binding protein, partial [Chitinophagaceae bacterium]|nr:FAD-binding protein [Chitinophagaceae bacterium]